MRKRRKAAWKAVALRHITQWAFAGVLIVGALVQPVARGADIVLHATQASDTSGWQVFQPGEAHAFHLIGDLRADPTLRWNLLIPEPGRYRVRLLARSESTGVIPTIKTGTGETLSGNEEVPRYWEKLELGELSLAQGPGVLELRFKSGHNPAGRAHLQAVELVECGQAKQEEARALEARADTRWMRQAGFGVMVHWTRESAPAQGAAKTYPQAVADLDTEALATRLSLTGAGFVVFTTAHAYQDFPAPLTSLEAVMPGRTTRRDLVAELAASLKRRGMSLILYHNPGTARDSAWLKACGAGRGDEPRRFDLWRAIIAEAGTRYGDRLAGWWFDDGATRLYPSHAPWESLHAAARAGNPGRVIGFNSWEFPSVTPWQDFDCGEGLREARGREGRLPPTGDGIYRSSSRRNLQATACVTIEDDWIHRESGKMPSPPTWQETALQDFLKNSRRSGLVPILNLKITQEGLFNASSLEMVRRAGSRQPR